jgi:hypothetical protein
MAEGLVTRSCATATPGLRPKGRGRPREAAPSGSTLARSRSGATPTGAARPAADE